MTKLNWTFKDDQALIVAKAGLLSKGWIEQVESGICITNEGYRKAYEIWMSFDDETRILLSTFVKRIIVRNVLGNKDKDSA